MENKNKDDIDSFWDIEDLIPKKSRASIPRRPRDTSSVVITINEDGKKYTSSVGAERPAVRADGNESIQADALKINIPGVVAASELIPKREDAGRLNGAYEYDRPDKAVCHVKISPWPVRFGFYSQFKALAAKYYHLKSGECEYIPFVSFMPQYEQMTRGQFNYFLYFRDRARHGVYVKTDSCYIFLLLFELINLPELCPPEESVSLMCGIWAAYRDTFGYLDKYLGEWLCDYCLIHDVSPDAEKINPFIGSVCMKMQLPEFYSGSSGYAHSYAELAAASDYNYKRSRYYQVNSVLWDAHIPAAVEAAAEKFLTGDSTADISHFTRDSYSGAVVSQEQKYKIEVTCHSLRRSHTACRTVTDMIKYCENRMRGVCSIRSRFNKLTLSDEIKNALDEYFDKAFPKSPRPKRADDTSYLALYERSTDEKADISRALEIERESWETAEILQTETEDEPDALKEPETEKNVLSTPYTPSEPDGEDGESTYDGFVSSLDGELKTMLIKAVDGTLEGYCKSAGLIPDDVKRRLNELASDYTGDVIFENGEIIEDYLAELKQALGI